MLGLASSRSIQLIAAPPWCHNPLSHRAGGTFQAGGHGGDGTVPAQANTATCVSKRSVLIYADSSTARSSLTYEAKLAADGLFTLKTGRRLYFLEEQLQRWAPTERN